MTDQPTNRPQRGASPAQDADTARSHAEAAHDETKKGGDLARGAVLAQLAVAHAQLAQASLLSAILRELRAQAEDDAEERRTEAAHAVAVARTRGPA